MTLTDRLGRLRFHQQIGQPYADLIKEAIKPAIGMTAVTKYLGAGVEWAIYVGLFTVGAMLITSVLCGWLVVKYRVFQAATKAEWDANPVISRQLELLAQIALNTGRA